MTLVHCSPSLINDHLATIQKLEIELLTIPDEKLSKWIVRLPIVKCFSIHFPFLIYSSTKAQMMRMRKTENGFKALADALKELPNLERVSINEWILPNPKQCFQHLLTSLEGKDIKFDVALSGTAFIGNADDIIEIESGAGISVKDKKFFGGFEIEDQDLQKRLSLSENDRKQIEEDKKSAKISVPWIQTVPLFENSKGATTFPMGKIIITSASVHEENKPLTLREVFNRTLAQHKGDLASLSDDPKHLPSEEDKSVDTTYAAAPTMPSRSASLPPSCAPLTLSRPPSCASLASSRSPSCASLTSLLYVNDEDSFDEDTETTDSIISTSVRVVQTLRRSEVSNYASAPDMMIELSSDDAAFLKLYQGWKAVTQDVLTSQQKIQHLMEELEKEKEVLQQKETDLQQKRQALDDKLA